MEPTVTPPRPFDQRPLPFVARKDLSARELAYGDQRYWVLKDPLRGELFRLRADQYRLHQLLDGQRSLADVRAALAGEFRDLTWSIEDVQTLTADLFRKGLLWSTRPGQGAALARRLRESRRQRLLGVLKNPLFIKLPGFDPQRILDRVSPMVRWAFHPLAIFAAVVLLAAVWGNTVVHWQQFRERAPTFSEQMLGQSLVWTWAVVGLVKILHEFGHALACRHFGGECHEIGVSLMMLSPSMYCDVSDAGRLESRRARIAIGAAGMYVELVLGAAALALWWLTREGLLHQLSWTVCLVTSASVVFFNLNPLLRLDGYFMLCDWLAIPNLRQKADGIVRRGFARAALGISLPDDPLLPERRRGWFVAYAVASTIYRIQLAAVIALILYRALKPYGLASAGLVVGAVSVAAAAVGVCRSVLTLWRENRHRVRSSWRPRVVAALALGALVAAFVVPIPVVVTAPLVIEPAGGQQAYVTTPGRLVAIRVRPGQHVRRGDVLVELANWELADEYRELVATYQVKAIDVKVGQATGDAAQTATATEAATALYEEVADLHDELGRLAITAPCDGIVLAPPPAAATPGEGKRRGGRLAGTPLDRANAGAFLPAGTPVATVAPAEKYQAVLLLEQSAIADMPLGRPVRMKLEHAPGEVLRGAVASASPPDAARTVSADQFSGEKAAAIQGDAAGQTVSQVCVPLAEADAPLAAGLRGEARVLVFRRSLIAWAWRAVRLNFGLL